MEFKESSYSSSRVATARFLFAMNAGVTNDAFVAFTTFANKKFRKLSLFSNTGGFGRFGPN